MSSLLIVNLGAVVSGDWRQPLHDASSIYIDDGRIAELPSSRSDADTIIDARGLIAAPGRIDTHVHPTLGDFTPTQNRVGWRTTRARIAAGRPGAQVVQVPLGSGETLR